MLNGCRDKSGVTLVELLIAVAVFSFIVSSAYLLFRSFSRVYSRGLERSEKRERARLVSEVLYRDLTGMCVRCEGSVDRLVFLSTRKRGDDFHMAEIHYRFEGDKFYRAVEWDTDYDFSTVGEEEVLTDRLERGRLDYYYDTWKATCGPDLPKAVRCVLRWQGDRTDSVFSYEVMANAVE